MNVGSIMTDQVKTVFLDTALEEIKELFAGHHFHHLPVVDSTGKIKGMISRLDLQMVSYQVASEGQTQMTKISESATYAKDIMSDQVAFIRPDDPIEEAIRVFLDNLMHALPVVDSGKVVGIITTFDVLKYFSENRSLLT